MSHNFSSRLHARLRSHAVHWLSVALAYSSLFLLGLADNLRGPLYPDVMKDLQLSDAQGAWLWAVASGFGFVGAVMAPAWMNRAGLHGTLKWALSLMVAGQLTMALSPHLSIALLGSLFFGMSIGLLGVVQNLLVLQAGPAHLIQKLQAGLHSNYAGASLLAPLFLAGLAFWIPGWRFGYAGGALLSLIGLVFIWRQKSASIEGHHHARTKHQDPGKFQKFYAYWVGGVLALYVVMEIMVSSRLALFLRREAQFDFQSASLATTLFFVGLLSGRVVFIFWRPSFSLKLQMLASLTGSLLLMVLALYGDPRWLILSGFTMAPFYPLAMSYLGSEFPKHMGQATAAAVALNGVCVVLMHLGVGGLTESMGIVDALKIGPVTAVVAIVMLAIDPWIKKVRA